MSDSNSRFGIQSTIDRLSLNFDKLENAHYGLLKKFQEDNETKSRSKDSYSPKISQAEMKKKVIIESGFDRLDTLKKNYNEEVANLKTILFGQANRSSTQHKNDNGTSKLCQNCVESSINSLKERILTIDDIKSSEKTVIKKVENYFDSTMRDINLAFSQVNNLNEKGALLQSTIDKMLVSSSVNLESIHNVENIVSSLKKKIVSSFNDMTNLTVSFEKETQSLQNGLDQVKMLLRDTGKRISNIEKQGPSVLKETTEIKKSLIKMDDLLSESVDIDLKKDKLFTNLKDKTHSMYKKITSNLKEIIYSIEGPNASTKKAIGSLGGENGPHVQMIAIDSPRLEKRNMSMPNQFIKSREHFEKMLLSGVSRNHEDLLSRSRSFQVGNASVEQSRLIDKAFETEFTSNAYDEKHTVGYSSENLRMSRAFNQTPTLEATNQLKVQLPSLMKATTSLQLSAKNLILLGKKALEISSKDFRPNKFALKAYKESQDAFEKRAQELSKIAEQVSAAIKSTTSTNNFFDIRPSSPPLSAANKYSSLFKILEKDRKSVEPLELPSSRTRKLLDKYEDVHPHSAQKSGFKSFDMGSALFKVDNASATTLAQSPLDFFLQKQEALENSKIRSRSHSPNRIGFQEVKTLEDQNRTLAQENDNLVKATKKLKSKADERKANIRELYTLLNMKDSELSSYKNKGQDDTIRKVEELFKLAESRLEKDFLSLEKKLNYKEAKIQALEYDVIKVLSHKSRAKEGLNGTQTGSASFNVQTYLVRDARRGTETKVRMTSADGNKKIQNALLKERIPEFDKINPDSIKQLETEVKGVRGEKRQIEEKYNALLTDMESIQDHRKRIEASYQEEVEVLNNKIAQLNDYVEDLESKYNKKVKEYISPIAKPRKTSNQQDNITEELIQSFETERRAVIQKIEKLLQELKVDKETYESMGIVEKMDKLRKVLKTKLSRKKYVEDKLNEERLTSEPAEDPLIVNTLTGEIEIQKKQFLEQEALVNSIQANLQKRIQDNQKLSSALATRSKEFEKLISEKASENKKTKELSEQYQALEKAKFKLDQDIKVLCDKIAEISTKHGLKNSRKLDDGAVYIDESFRLLDLSLDEHKKREENEMNINKKALLMAKEYENKQEILNKKVNQLTENISDLSKNNHDILKQLRDKEAEVKLIKEKLKGGENIEKESLQEIEKIKIINQGLMDDLSRAKNQTDSVKAQLQKEIANLKRGAETDAVAMKKGQDQLKEHFNKEVESYKAEISKLNLQIKELNTIRDQFEKNRTDLEKALESKHEDGSNLQRDLESLRASASLLLNERISENQRISAEKDKIRKELEASHRELSSYKATKEQEMEAINNQLKLQKDDSKTTERNLKEKLVLEENNVSQLRKELSELTNRIKDQETLRMNSSDEIQSIKSANENFIQELKEKESAIQRLLKELDITKSFNKEYEKEAVQLKSYIKTLEDGKVNVEGYLNQRVKDLVTEKEELKAHLILLEAKLADNDSEINHLKEDANKENSTMQVQLNTQVQEVKILQAKLEQTSQLSKDLQDKLNRSEKELSELGNINKTLREEIEILSKSSSMKNVVHHTEVRSLQEQNTQSQISIDNLQKKNKIVLEERTAIIKNLQNDHTRMQDDLCAMTDKFNSLTEENRTLIEDFKEKSMDQENQISTIREQNKTIQEENKTLVDDYNKKIKELNNLVIDLKTDNKALTEEKNILLESHDGATQDLSSRVDDLRKEIETNQIELRQSNQRASDLGEQLNEATQKYNDLNQISVNQQNDIETLRAEVDNNNKNHDIALDDLNQELEELQKDLEKEREQVNKLLKDHHDDVLKKNDQIRGLEAKIDELENLLQYEKQLKSTSIIVDDGQLKLESQELKTNSLELKIHIEQPPQNKPSEFKINHLAQVQDKEHGSIVFDTPNSIIPMTGSGFASELKFIKDTFGTPNIGTINSNALSPFRDGSVNTSKVDYMDSKSSITNNRKLNRFRVLRSLNNLEENKGRNIQHVVNLEKEVETLNEQRKELENERRTLKAQLTTSIIEIEELKKDKEEKQELEAILEKPMPEIKSFLKKAHSVMLPDDEASSPTLQADPQTKIEKLKKDIKRLREERQNIREENSELRGSIKTFQEQIVSLNEIIRRNQAAGGPKKENNEIVSTVYESLVQLFNMETLRGKVEVKLTTKEEAKETMGYVKQAFEENEEDIMALVKELDEYDKYREESEAVKAKVSAVEKEWQEKVTEINERLKEERKRCRDDINFVENDMYQRFLKISQAIASFIKENAIAEVHSYRDTYPRTDGFVSLENVIYANLNILREYIEACVQVQDSYERLLAKNKEREEKDAQTERDREQEREKEKERDRQREKDIKALERENQKLKESKNKIDEEDENKEDSIITGSDQARDPLSKNSNTIEELKKFFNDKERFTTFGGSPSNATREFDHGGPPTFQDIGEPQDQVPNPTKTENLLAGNEELIKSLYEQVKAFEDKNEKLKKDYEESQEDFNALKLICDDLKATNADKEEHIKGLEAKIADLPPAPENKYTDQTKSSAEKEHTKAIFVKFMQSALKGEVDSANELLRLLLALLQVSEPNQVQIIEDFKQKSLKKKGVFSKLFK